MPHRRCVGCGRIAPKPELLRIVAVADGGAARSRAVCDRTGTMPGRGAYICRDGDSERAVAECLQTALKRGGIPRALRSAVTVEAKLVESVGP